MQCGIVNFAADMRIKDLMFGNRMINVWPISCRGGVRRSLRLRFKGSRPSPIGHFGEQIQSRINVARQ